MKVLSLFSGVGGFDMGLENAGMETVFQCEWDKHANTILNKHWPDVPKWDDVSTLTGKHILAGRPIIDVVAWGSPCQDLSVAGKRSGLEGERSGLFHEGIRIIKELRKETNGQYPRISIWENVVGALNSNRGADFGIILDEMAEAGALVIEWAVLDAQHFGIPQRRRRVFVIAIFDPAIAQRCPNPLLPVAESLPGHLAKGKPARKSAANTLTESIGTDGTWWDGRDTAEALTTTSNEQRMPDKQRFQAIVESFTPSSFANYAEGVGTLRSNGGDLGGGSETLVTEATQMKNVPVKEIVGSLQARVTATNHESIRDGHAIVEEPMLIDGTRVDDVRIYEPPVQTLKQRMGTGGNNVPVIGFSHTQGLDAQPSEKAWPTLRKEGSGHAVAIPIDTRNALRDPEKYDEQNRQGLGIGADGDPMATLTPAHVNAVAYDEYNDTIGATHHALRAGTKQSTGVLIDNEVVGTLRSGGDGGVPSSRGEHLVAEPTMAVRRLTPLECERLMGWPDDHTRWKADGTEQADTHRYKQCGNGVASPVAQWIGKHLLEI
jgi:DNA (cytosine-5)-methyltransferase 1